MPAHLPFEERQLIEKCLAGDEAAWSLLIFHYGDGVRLAFRRRLRAWGADWWLVEDLQLRFWEELWRRRATRLRGYDARVAGLATFLNHLVGWQVQDWWRACGRQGKRPQPVPLPPRELPAPGSGCYPQGIFLDEVTGLLTAQERRRFNELCGEAASDGACPLSNTNRWKIDERLRRKVLPLLGFSEEARN
jgi:hypothetical protein